MDNIEEVKKILIRVGETYHSSEDPITRGKILVWAIGELSKICQLFPQPLDDEGLREKIAVRIPRPDCHSCSICHSWDKVLSYKDKGCPYQYRIANPILALRQPKIEEARLQGYATGCDATTKGFSHAVEEARKQERERIFNLIERYRVHTPNGFLPEKIIYQMPREVRQALEGGE